ncbi:uncharacterized protein J4E84_007792 [Alternaria hordeiaustralica]|uniref:uncharacterized protein n=1 Tax=Alternaria hordeiaustralica TaxID=1187925 RepID=UPI0020C2ACB5|nr:uncharacterized protein J4E84_007792 [Alternaria hordeiaustralica]KAI4680654.1 hypothetical protein J4E84_007792 [Alternaria hordeiaustralica]
MIGTVYKQVTPRAHLRSNETNHRLQRGPPQQHYYVRQWKDIKQRYMEAAEDDE